MHSLMKSPAHLICLLSRDPLSCRNCTSQTSPLGLFLRYPFDWAEKDATMHWAAEMVRQIYDAHWVLCTGPFNKKKKHPYMTPAGYCTASSTTVLLSDAVLSLHAWCQMGRETSPGVHLHIHSQGLATAVIKLEYVMCMYTDKRGKRTGATELKSITITISKATVLWWIY